MQPDNAKQGNLQGNWAVDRLSICFSKTEDVPVTTIAF